MGRVGLVSLFMVFAVPAVAGEDEGTSGPYQWSEVDRQASQEACRTLTRTAGLCECLLDGLQAQFRSLDDLVQNREKSRDRAAELAGLRCEARFGK